MESTISLLEAVKATMDTISVVGVVNQDKFVGCYNAIAAAIEQIKKESSEEKENG